jgi:hypothetical protein
MISIIIFVVSTLIIVNLYSSLAESKREVRVWKYIAELTGQKVNRLMEV